MTDVAAQGGTLETPKDAGKGSAGVYKRWMMELDLADKGEKNWRERAKDVNARYRDEKEDSTSNNYSINDNRYSSSNRFNILYSNVQTICPALYNQSPKPDVRRRYRDADKLGKVIADIMERALSFTMDDYDFDRFMRLSVKDCQLSGRGVTRVKYKPEFETATDENGEEYEEKKYEAVCWEHVDWRDFRHGPGRTWEEVTWVAFKHRLTKKDGNEQFPDTFNDVDMDYTPAGMEDDDGNPINDSFKRCVVWEIWDKAEKKVIFIAPSLKERPLKTEEDPLGLSHFFPIPRPLYATENTDSTVPVEPFRFYRDQADELDQMTKRISGIIKACKVRGIYDSTINEMSSLMNSSENIMIPAGDILPLMQSGGLDKAIWMYPIETIAGVLVYLYNQRDAIKTTIYEITGIADIMRGSSAASETLGAQQLKAQFGTMRLDDMRREVQRYARDLVRMAGEIMAEHFSVDTMAIMTEVKLPTNEQKQEAMFAAQQLEAEKQPIPKKLKEGLKLPTWEEALDILRDDKQRAYRIDIETDSTVAGDQAADQKAITELLTGISAFIQQAGPAVQAGYMPLDAAKSLLMTAVRRFKMGREVEDALDMIGVEEEGEEEPKGPDPTQIAAQQAQAAEQAQQMQEMKEQLGALSQENQMLKVKDANKANELDIKSRELKLKEDETFRKIREEMNTPPVDKVELAFVEKEKEREKMAHDSMEADKDRQVELAKAIYATKDVDESGKSEAMSDSMNQAAMMMEQITAALTAPRSVIYDDFGNVIGSETIL
jgi:hypothetical protein